jgi:predicted tellurium resistance membrane protein TerC
LGCCAHHCHVWLFIFGLLLSIPLIIFGSQIITGIIDRFPIFIWLGAALLGWIAGSMLVDDIWILGWLKANAATWVMPNPKNVAELLPVAWLHYTAAAIGAGIVLAAGYFVKQRRVAAH